MPKVNKLISIDAKLHRRVQDLAATRRTSANALIEDAIKQRFDVRAQESADLVMLRTARMLRLKMDRLDLAMRANSEMLAMVARMLLAALPTPLPEQQAQAAKAFERMADVLTAKLSKKGTLLDPLLDSVPAEPDPEPSTPHYDDELPP